MLVLRVNEYAQTLSILQRHVPEITDHDLALLVVNIVPLWTSEFTTRRRNLANYRPCNGGGSDTDAVFRKVVSGWPLNSSAVL